MKRGRNQRRRQGVNPNRALDSNGPEVRIRGTANQIYDKYINLARDASSAGDRIKAESYLQHAEHYFRLIRSMQPPQQQATPYTGEGEQPSVAEEPSADRTQSRAPAAAPSEEAPKAAESDKDAQQTSASEPDAGANDAEKDAEKKPRRRTRRRRVKATDEAGENAAASGDANDSKETVAAAAE
ncbi:MAG: DUF4167 domain-containing protein [Pseudomonadota bacterium]